MGVDSWGVPDQKGHGSQLHCSPRPCLRGGTAHKALPRSWEAEGQRCESPDVCPDLDVGNFQPENDSTPEISSFHLKSESEKAGPCSALCECVCVCVCVCVCGGEGRKSGYLDANPGYTIILLHDLEHLTSSQ
uniref:Uncharacterized protein n=1 Tax=Pipistrellus kuhlii TaxID=59472 RepID=A0A7J7VV55_PIPKU|nr:hypothetical protein mPipKuh1_008258 [Pipistrellus kuhlii]